jgi:hypothetical protein
MHVRGRPANVKCEICGQTIQGGRGKLNQHKSDCHSY